MERRRRSRSAPRSTVSWSLPAATQPRWVQPVVELVPGSPARTKFSANGAKLGTVDFGDVGRQGNSPSPTELTPVRLSGIVGARAATVTAQTSGGTGRIDSLLVMPEVATLSASGEGRGTAVLSSKSKTTEYREVAVAGGGCASVGVYDRNGRDQRHYRDCDGSVRVMVAAGGFSIVQR